MAETFVLAVKMQEIKMKILIADDHALFRDGLSMHLEQIAPDAVISQAGNFSQALKILDAEPKIDLIIIDLDMPDMKWEEGLSQLKSKAPDSRFVVISASEMLTSALKLILDGGTYLPPSILEHANSGLFGDQSRDGKGKGKTLTPRQSEVLSYVAEGMSNKQIAYKMGVSEATVKLHINALLRAVGATNRTQAVIIAQKMGLI